MQDRQSTKNKAMQAMHVNPSQATCMSQYMTRINQDSMLIGLPGVCFKGERSLNAIPTRPAVGGLALCNVFTLGWAPSETSTHKDTVLLFEFVMQRGWHVEACLSPPLRSRIWLCRFPSPFSGLGLGFVETFCIPCSWRMPL